MGESALYFFAKNNGILNILEHKNTILTFKVVWLAIEPPS